MAADTMSLVADDVQTLVIPGVGHWLAEQAPEELLVALIKFLAPSRGGTRTVTRAGQTRSSRRTSPNEDHSSEQEH
jgi:hypothetical protein